jgi:hypothetical protein
MGTVLEIEEFRAHIVKSLDGRLISKIGRGPVLYQDGSTDSDFVHNVPVSPRS